MKGNEQKLSSVDSLILTFENRKERIKKGTEMNAQLSPKHNQQIVRFQQALVRKNGSENEEVASAVRKLTEQITGMSTLSAIAYTDELMKRMELN